MRLRAPIKALLLASLTALPTYVNAQTVLVRVLDGDTGTPVFGALAYLEGADAAVMKTGLTDELGRALFLGLTPGRVRVRIEMIGKATGYSEFFEVAAGATVTQDIRLASSAILLQGIEIEADGGRCRIRPERGLSVAALWDETRKALSAAAFTEDQAVYRYQTASYVRELGLDARTIEKEDRRRSSGYLRTPFESKPAEDLIENGFVQTDQDGQLFFAPDANVLLSDAFLDSHCFRLAAGRGEAEGLVGLRFEPSGGRRGVIDISGTLWVDPQTVELQWLEYHYEGLDPDTNSPDVGGRVDFQRLPNGTWIVPEWWIQMPRVGVTYDLRGRPQTRIVSYRRTGGQVLQVQEAGGRTVIEAETGTIEGVVLDSLGVDPLPAARVGIVGSSQTVYTTEQGHFSIRGLTSGSYQLSFSHQTVDELGYRPAPVTYDVVEGQVTAVQFRMPAQSDVVFEACRGEDMSYGSGAVLGQAVDARGRPVPRATLALWWDELFPIIGAAPRIETIQLEATADMDGYYSLCGVPEDRRLRILGLPEGEVLAIQINTGDLLMQLGDTLRVLGRAGAVVHRVEVRPRG